MHAHLRGPKGLLSFCQIINKTKVAAFIVSEKSINMRYPASVKEGQ